MEIHLPAARQLPLDGLRDDNRASVEGWLRDTSFSHTAIAKWVREDSPEDSFVGYRATKETISEWRRSHGIG